MKNNWLWIAFAALLILFIASRLWDKKPQRSFDADFLKFKTELIDEIVIHPKENTGQVFSLNKNGDTWRVADETVEAEAMTSAVESMLKTLDEIRAKRVVAKTSDKWGEYEVDEGKGRRIELLSDGKRVEELILGRFDFNQQSKSAKSYVRHAKDDNVYVVDGFLSMTLGQNRDAFRNKEIVNIPKEQIDHLTLTVGAESNSLRKENYWVDAANQILDSTAIDGYLTRLATLSGRNFVDAFDTGAVEIASLSVGNTSAAEPLKITCYQGQKTPFVLHSSHNPESYFSSDSAGIFKTAFGELIELIDN